MISEIISKIVNNAELNIEEKTELTHFFERMQYIPAQVESLFKKSTNITTLSQITENLGDVRAGRFISANSSSTAPEPTDAGFTGSFLSGQGETFGATTYNVGGVTAGVLQAGFNNSGEFIAGAGNVKLNASGIILSALDNNLSKIKWYDGVDLVGDLQVYKNALDNHVLYANIPDGVVWTTSGNFQLDGYGILLLNGTLSKLGLKERATEPAYLADYAQLYYLNTGALKVRHKQGAVETEFTLSGGDISGTGVVGQVAEFVTNTKTLQAAKIIGPAANILTITNAAASTLAYNVSSGKTVTITATDNSSIIFTGACNLTIPTAGSVTVGLLGTIQTWTAANTFTDILTHTLTLSTPTVTTNGMVLSYTHAAGATLASGGQRGISLTQTLTGSAGAGVVTGLLFSSLNSNTGTVDALYGINGLARTNSSSGNTTLAAGVRGGVGTIGAGTITEGAAFLALPPSKTTTGNLTSTMGVWVNNQGVSGSTASYGLLIDAQSGSTTNYAIQTGAGLVTFNAAGAAQADFTAKTDNYNAIFMDTSNDSIVIMSNAAGKVGLWGVAAAVQPPAWTLSNSATLRTIDAHSLTLDNLADAFCTLVKDLSSWGAVGTA